MKKLLILFSLLGVFVSTMSQDFNPLGGQNSADIKDPVVWDGAITKKGEDTYTLSFSALIDEEWHIYSQHTPNEGIGPIPLSVDFLKVDTDFSLEGPLEESKTYREFSDVWGFDEVFFKEEGTLTQNVKLLTQDTKLIKAELFYQVCKEVCLNEERYIVFNLATNKVKFIKNYDDFEAYSGVKEVEATIKQGKEEVSVDNTEVIKDQKQSKKRGLWSIFFIAFLSGFAALLTPCVFPMIPLTVSFFTKQSKIYCIQKILQNVCILNDKKPLIGGG